MNMEEKTNLGNKREEALKSCDKVINGIEDGNISVLSSLLLCKKIARLVNDQEGIEWLNCEYSGYPCNENGLVDQHYWQIAKNHGRSFKEKNEKNGIYEEYIFTSLCSELEIAIDSKMKSLGNFSTKGFSVSGDWAQFATDKLTSPVSINTNVLLDGIRKSEKHLTILKSQYYDYAVRWKIELSFGNSARTIFEEYQEKVDSYYSSLPLQIIQKLNAIEETLYDGNPERYSQVLTSCRRLWTDIAKNLFNEFFPNYSNKTYTTKQGKEIDISGDHDNNKISAIVEKLQAKAANNTLVGSEIIYLIDWIEQINKNQSSGVHSEVTRNQAMQCIIHTYIALGDILHLRQTYLKESNKEG